MCMHMHMHMHIRPATCYMPHATCFLPPATCDPTYQVERWTGARVVAWAAALEDGKYAHVAHCFARSSGKLLSCEWELDVCKWVVAAGGTEEEGHAIFQAFQAMQREAKRAQKAARPRPPVAPRIVEPCVVGGNFMAD